MATNSRKIEPFSASTVKKCPKCGAKAERQISAAGIQFKGSGWYVTDYKGKSAASGPSESSKDSGSGSDSSSDSKVIRFKGLQILRFQIFGFEIVERLQIQRLEILGRKIF